MTLPFLPFARPTLDEETIAAVAEVLRSGWITSGPRVREFEDALTRYLGGERTVRSFTSATAGLEIALQACGIGPGDEVVVPAMTFAASANVVLRVGARPVLVDVEADTRNLDPQRLRDAITGRTRAIMPVHFAGLAADLDAIGSIARERGLRVIEDAAHAIGTRHQGRLVGSYGDLVCFSFHPNKNMTTIEGGALSFPGGAAAEVRCADLERFHGIVRNAEGELDVQIPGGKSNLSDVSACIGLAQLAKLDGFIERRHALVARYFERLHTDPAMVLPARGDAGHSWHIFAPLLPLDRLRLSRSGFVAALQARGIGAGVHYPSLAGFGAYQRLGYRTEQFPNAAHIGANTLTLPLFPGMQPADVDRVCDACAEIIEVNRL